MNWEAIGVIAEVVGAIAVVITLLYLALEVKRNRSATESSSVDALAEGFNALNSLLADSPELAEIWLSGMSDPNSLNGIQRVRLIALVQSYVNHFTTVKKHYDAGLLPHDQWMTHSSGFPQTMTSKGGQWIRQYITITPDVLKVFEELDREGLKEGYWGITKNQ
ncbi:MAG: hypothetical protein RIC85_01540 [Gammaproteobacteria bacterium]